MKAVAYRHSHPADHPEALLDLDLPEPGPPKGRDLLVEVRAVSVNPVDAKVRKRSDPAGEPKVLGWDASGVVRAAGPDARLFRPGQEVYYAGDVGRPGTNAELHLVDERIVGPKPRSLTHAEAAALPPTAITAWEALFDRLRIARDPAPTGEALLITGGAGGVGSVAIQLARRLTGMRVVATASRPETRAWCLDLGAHDVLDHARDLAPQAKALGAPVTKVFSVTASDRHWDAICDLLAPFGAVCLIDDPEPVDARKLKWKCASLHWELMFARPLHGAADVEEQHRLLAEVSRLVDEGAIRTTVGERFGAINAANLRRAHAVVEAGTARGKIVLEGF